MFTENLEFLGLVLFFVVNVMYSAMIGMDLSTFLSQILGGNVAGQNWVILIAFIVIVVLVLNFTSSVLTMMTLGNLYYKFGAKGSPIMLSPEYRLELNNIKGLFVSIIVLVTVLALRLFLSPDQMANGMFEWMNIIPTEVSTYGHFILSLVVFGLMTAIHYIITPDYHNSTDVKLPSLPSDFKYYYRNLYYALMSIVFLYAIPFFIGIVGWMFPEMTGFGTNGIYNWFSEISTKRKISAFDLFIIVVSFLLVGLSIQDSEREKGYGLGFFASMLFVGGIATLILYTIIKWIRSIIIQNKSTGFNFMPYLNAIKNGFVFVMSFISFLLFMLYGFDKLEDNAAKHNPKIKKSMPGLNGWIDFVNSETVTNKFMVFLISLLPISSLITAIRGYMASRGDPEKDCSKINEPESGIRSSINQFGKIIWCIFDNMNYGLNISLIEVFNIIKGLFIVLAFIFSGLTINEYSKDIASTDKYNMYNSKFNFNVMFGFSMFFLLVALGSSFFNTDNFPKFLAMSVEYLAPVIILIMASFLVYYANHLAKLSKKEVISDVQKEKKKEREQPDNGDKNAPVATSKTYDGTTHKI